MADRIVVVALVDRQGAILLRRRDEASAVRANRWGLPGGAARPQEPATRAAGRLVREQTGLSVAEKDLRIAWTGTLIEHDVDVTFFAVATDATNDDIPVDPVPGAAARYKDFVTYFLPGDVVLNGRSFTTITGHVIGTFLDSLLYRELSARRAPEDLA